MTLLRALAVCCLACGTSWVVFGAEQSIRFVEQTPVGLREALDGMMAHAAAWGDIDDDGDLDLYVGGFADRPDAEYAPARGPVSNRLLRHVSAGRFERVHSPALELFGRTTATVFADLDNNGTLDLYITNNTRSQSRLAPGRQRDAQLRTSALFRNDRGFFADVSAESGDCLTAPGSARAIGVLDYDADGALDVFVVEDRFGGSPHSRLCRNAGRFRFVDVTSKVGLPANLYGLAAAIADLNGDGRPDIFVSHSNRLFLSNGDGTYAEPDGPKPVFKWAPLDAEDWPAGAVFGDLNRDGRLDLIVGIHHDRARNRVYLNDGVERGIPVFRDVSAESGMPARLPTKSPHVEVQDFDNDGWPDLYFSSAWQDRDGSVTPVVFRSVGRPGGVPRFEPLRQVTEKARLVYFPAGPAADFDADGRVDLFLANWFRSNHARLLKNVSSPNRWLEITVLGRTMNRMGIGAKVRVYRAGQLNRDAAMVGYQEIGTAYGFASAQPAIAHFGLGVEGVVDVGVEFPNGSKAAFQNVTVDRRLEVQGP